MRVSSAVRLVLACVVAVGWRHVHAGAGGDTAADIDVEFVQDGKTTYCQGLHHEEGALVFEELKVSSAGKCPIQVDLSVASTKIATTATPVAVTWTASLAKGDQSSSLFPRVVDSTTKLPKNVIASLLRACKAGSNCAQEADVVVPGATSSAADAVGAFDATGKKALQSFQFQFPQNGEYVIVGKVVLPGDAALNISATEFVAFQKVIVGAATTSKDSDTPGTVKPADPNNSTTSGGVIGGAANVKVDAKEASNAGLESAPTSSKNNNLMLLGVIAGVGAIGALAAFAISRKRSRRNGMPRFPDEVQGGSIYRLDAASNGHRRPTPPPAKMVPGQPPKRQYKKAYQPRYYDAHPSSLPSEAPVVFHNVVNTNTNRSGGTVRGFTDSNGEMLHTRSSTSSEDMLAHSHGTSSFGGLHDSAVHIPTQPRQYRESNESALSSLYTDSIDEYSDIGEEPPRIKPVTLYSDSDLDPDRTTNLSEYDAHGLDQSTYSWVYSESDVGFGNTHGPRGTEI